jgi:hypothetical protein
MNKYASGYALVNIFAVLGVVLIFVSLVIGVLVADEIGTLGYVIIIFGAFQGLIVVGMGSIGRAVLDGSVAQQQILDIHQSNRGKEKGRHNKGGPAVSNSKNANQSESTDEIIDSENSWALVDKVEMLAKAGKIPAAVTVLDSIEDTTQLAWARFAVAEAYSTIGDGANFKKYADEAISAARQIIDVEERDSALGAINASLRNVK